ncbi:MAG: hypothetical protein EXS17_01805 [Phycisphaerales bacterium]|nr:hypothetical protein [Phycisphaerales bacterium]
MRILPIVAAVFATSSALAGSFNFQVLPTSVAQQSLTVTYPLAGTFKGDYDATTNPTGTRTIPGYFGGSGNNLIAYTASTQMGDTLNSHPAGSFVLTLNEPGAVVISMFTTDLINGTPGDVGIDMTITYPSFHTVAPNSIYPSVGAITIPIASGYLKVASAVQSGPAIGTRVETTPNTYTVTVLIPVLVVASGSASGQPFGADPTPGVIALTGTLVVNGSTATFTATSSMSEPVGPLPPPPPIVDQAFPLPTVLPAGGTANLLLSGVFSEGNGTSTLNLSINAAGTAAAVSGDLNGDQLVSAIDLAIVLSAWGTSSPVADINQDGTVNGADLLFVLSNWTI